MFYSLVIYPLTQIIELVYSFCDKLFDNTGIAILGVSCAVSLLTLPLYIVAEHWQQVERNKQSSMAAEIAKIKAVFKGNEQYMILSTYYRQQHYHPIMGLRSAFGLLIQVPFFTAAYACLSHMSALQGHSFLFIRDMGAPDALFHIDAFAVNVLPIAMTLINMISSTIYTKGFAIHEKLYTYGLALIFVVILYNSPAGLVMYWTMNNLFSLIKNVFYKMKNPVRNLYYIACGLITVFIGWILIFRPVSLKRGLLISVCFALVYFAPLFVKACNYLIDNTFASLRDNFKLRSGIFFTSAIGLAVFIGLFISSNLISASPSEFCGIDGIGNPNFFVNNTFFQAAGFFIVWCSLIYFLYHERMQTLIAMFLSFIFFACILNFFAFQGNYGDLSKLLKFTTASNVDSSTVMILVNLIAVLALAVAIAFVIKFNKAKVFAYVTGIFAFAFLAISFVNKGTINKGYKQYLASGTTAKSIEPFIHLSKTGKNVILLYLDRAENTYVQPLFEEDFSLNKKFEGFKLFRNTVSFNGHTLLGAPSVYGGYEYTPENMNKRSDVKLVTKQNECLHVLPEILTKDGNDFTAVVTDPTWENYEIRPDLSTFVKKDGSGKFVENINPKVSAKITDSKYTDYWYREHTETANIPVTSKTIKRNLLWYGFFRSSPLALRPAWYNDGNYWSTDEDSDNFNDYLDGYSALEYLPRFTDTNAESTNVYVSFTNNTTHDGLYMEKPDYVPSSSVSQKDLAKQPGQDRSYDSFAGAMKRVAVWLDYLKEKGVYDNTRIVIVADHGCSNYERELPASDEKFSKMKPGHYHPLLMYKDFNDRTSTLQIDDTTFMTNADTPLLLLNGDNPKAEKLVEKAVNPFTGKELSAEKENGALICTSDGHDPKDFAPNIFNAKPDQWLRVKDNIFDSANWNYETVEAAK